MLLAASKKVVMWKYLKSEQPNTEEDSIYEIYNFFFFGGDLVQVD